MKCGLHIALQAGLIDAPNSSDLNLLDETNKIKGTLKVKCVYQQ